MLSKLDEFIIRIGLDASHMPAEYGQDLFHYTSPQGFTSILFGDSEKVTLWASRYDCLSDASEGKVVEEVFQEVCLEMKIRGEISEYLYQLFFAVKPARTILLNRNMGDCYKVTRPECDRYICSFSKNKDSLVIAYCYGLMF